MGIGMLLFWGLVIAVIVILAREFGAWPGRAGSAVSPKDSLEILRERYARGEIDSREFEERRRELTAR